MESDYQWLSNNTELHNDNYAKEILRTGLHWVLFSMKGVCSFVRKCSAVKLEKNPYQYLVIRRKASEISSAAEIQH